MNWHPDAHRQEPRPGIHSGLNSGLQAGQRDTNAAVPSTMPFWLFMGRRQRSIPPGTSPLSKQALPSTYQAAPRWLSLAARRPAPCVRLQRRVTGPAGSAQFLTLPMPGQRCWASPPTWGRELRRAGIPRHFPGVQEHEHVPPYWILSRGAHTGVLNSPHRDSSAVTAAVTPSGASCAGCSPCSSRARAAFSAWKQRRYRSRTGARRNGCCSAMKAPVAHLHAGKREAVGRCTSPPAASDGLNKVQLQRSVGEGASLECGRRRSRLM